MWTEGGDPWGQNVKKKEKKPEASPLLQAAQFVIRAEDWVDDQGKHTIAPLETLCVNATGLAIASLQDVQAFIDKLTSLSHDPLAVFIPGLFNTIPNVLHKQEILEIPTVYVPNNSPVIIKGNLIQLGDQNVQLANVSQKPLDVPDSTLFRVVVLKTDMSNAKWDSFKDQSNKCLSLHCHAFRDKVVAIWGRRINPSENIIQMMMRVENSALDEALKFSGTNGVFLVPLLADRSHHPDYAVVWLSADETKATADQYAKSDSRILGLVVQTKKDIIFGLRTLASDYQAVKLEVLGKVDGNEFIQARFKWLLGPLPIGINREGVQQLLNDEHIRGRPVTAAGERQWMVTTDAQPNNIVLQYAGGRAVFTPFKQFNQKTEQQSFVVGGQKGIGKGSRVNTQQSSSSSSGISCTFTSGTSSSNLFQPPPGLAASSQPSGPTVQKFSQLEDSLNKKFETLQAHLVEKVKTIEAQQLDIETKLANHAHGVQLELQATENRLNTGLQNTLEAFFARQQQANEANFEKQNKKLDHLMQVQRKRSAEEEPNATSRRAQSPLDVMST